jgi:hypothetical protein
MEVGYTMAKETKGELRAQVQEEVAFRRSVVLITSIGILAFAVSKMRSELDSQRRTIAMLERDYNERMRVERDASLKEWSERAAKGEVPDVKVG